MSRRTCCSSAWASRSSRAPRSRGWTPLARSRRRRAIGPVALFRERAGRRVGQRAGPRHRARARLATKQFGRDHSFAVVAQDFRRPGATFRRLGISRSSRRGRSASGEARAGPASRSRRLPASRWTRTYADLGTAFAGERVKVWKRCATTNTCTASARRVALGQARAATRRLHVHDVEQRHYGLPGVHDPIYALDAVLHGCGNGRPRHLPRQHFRTTSTSGTSRRVLP
jgi:hypothetical protein